MKTPLQTPEEIRHQIWKELGRASRDRHHDWRAPVLATTGLDGLASARTVVLRHAHTTTGELDFYTDSRSAKVHHLLAQPQAHLVFWSARLGWQLRAQVQITVMTCGPELEAIWRVVQQSPSASDYLSPLAPGVRLEAASVLANAGLTEPSNEPLSERKSIPFFAVLRAQLVQMDWLELSRTGHRRASLSHSSWAWVTP